MSEESELEWNERYERLREDILRRLVHSKKPNKAYLEALAVMERMHAALKGHIPECLTCMDERCVRCESGYTMCMECRHLYD